MMTKDDLTRSWHQRELVTRSAPRWAWDIIDETLAMDARAKNFDPILRKEITDALEAMVDACEGGEA